MKFTSDQIYEIIKKLTGEIRPVGESNQDSDRLENIQTFIDVFDMMHTEIDDIAYQYGERHEFSMKAIAEKCKKHIESMGISD